MPRTDVATFASSSGGAAAEVVSDGVLAGAAHGTGAGCTLVHVDAAVWTREPRGTLAPEPVDSIDAATSIVTRLAPAVINIYGGSKDFNGSSSFCCITSPPNRTPLIPYEEHPKRTVPIKCFVRTDTPTDQLVRENKEKSWVRETHAGQNIRAEQKSRRVYLVSSLK